MRPLRAWLLLLATPLAVAGPPGPPPGPAGAAPLPALADGSRSTEPSPRPRPPPSLARTPTPPPTARQMVLPNGLRVIVVARHQRPVVLIRLLFPRGALADSPATLGAAHLAVHVASDYHERSDRGGDLVEEKSFRMQFVELGGSVWFDVDSDYSAIGASGYARDTGEYLRMIGEAVRRPRRGEQAFRARRNQLLDAIEDLESSDPAALSRVVAQEAFGHGHPYARSVIGTAASLTPLGMEDVVARQEEIFVPGGATLLVVGDVAAEKVFAEARAAFGRWKAEGPPPAPPPPPPVVARGIRDVGLLRRVPASTLFVCATRPLSDVVGSDAALDVLVALLGEGSGSRLAAALRDGGGLTYDASATIVRRRHARAFLACSPLAADRAAQGIRLFREALEGVRAGRPTVEELERARAMLLARIDSVHDDAVGTTGAWVEAIVLGRGVPRRAGERAEIEKVTAEDVRALAAKVLAPDTIHWIASGDPKVAAPAVAETRLGGLRRLALTDRDGP